MAKSEGSPSAFHVFTGEEIVGLLSQNEGQYDASIMVWSRAYRAKRQSTSLSSSMVTGAFDVVKTVSSTAENPVGSGNYDVTIDYRVVNTGSSELTGINLVDDVFTQWGGAFLGIASPPSILSAMPTVSVNPMYNGNSDPNIIASNGMLAADDTLIVQVVFQVDASQATARLFNQAMASAQDTAAMPNIVTDLSGTSTGMDDRTPVDIPSLSIVKAISNVVPAASGTLGNFDITYDIAFTNNGTTPLEDISLSDDVSAQLMGAYVGVTTAPAILSSTASTDPTVGTLPMIFDGMDGLLNPGQVLNVRFTVEVDADAELMASLSNQATGSALPTDGMGASLPDPNNPGMNFGPISDNSGDAANNNNATPIPPMPSVHVAKTITGVNPASAVGNVIVDYAFEVQNTGNTRLDNISLIENFATSYGSAFVGVTTLPASPEGDANGSYDGTAANDDLLDQNGSLEAGESYVVTVSIELDPNAVGATINGDGQFVNQAEVFALPVDGMGATLNDFGGSPFTTLSDLSDTGEDAASTNPDELGDTGGHDDPTLLAVPMIGVAKTITDIQPAATPGNFNVTYAYTVQNNGSTNLSNIGIVDDFSAQYMGAWLSNVTAGPTTAFMNVTANASFDGSGNNNLLVPADTDLLQPNESFTVTLTAEVDANGISDTLFNSATASGLPIDGMGGPSYDIDSVPFMAVTDVSDSGTDPEGLNPVDFGDTGTAEDATPLLLPHVSVVKAITTVTDPGTTPKVGNVDVTYTFIIKNTGNTHLNNISLVDNFEDQYDGAFEGLISVPTTTVGGINPSYTGTNNNSEVLDGMATLSPNDSMIVVIVADIDPDNSEADYNVFGELQNQGFVTATPVDDMGGPIGDNFGVFGDVSDSSDTGSNADTDNDGEPNDETGNAPTYDDPTVLSVPSIVVAKEISNIAPAASGIQGNFDVTVRYAVQNDGNVELSNISLIDEISTQFGTALVDITTDANFASNTASAGPTLNGAYAGTGDLLSPAATDELEPNEGFVIDIVLEIDASMSSDTLLNQAIAQGQPQDRAGADIGMPVSDASDSGPDPESDNPLVADDKGTAEDSTSLVLPNISIVKRQMGFVETVDGPYGNVDLSFELTIMNTGNVPLTNIQINDNMASELGTGFVKVNDVQITNNTSTSTPSLNPNYNGSAPANIFTGSDGVLLTGESVTVEVEIEFNPIAANILAPLVNTAVGMGQDLSGATVSDDSDSGSDPESDNAMAPGNGFGPNAYDDPTPVEVPRVYVTKSFENSARAASNVVGNYDLTFLIKIQNTGNVDLDSIQIVDDMVSQFGTSFVEVLSATISNYDATTNPSLNAGFLGDSSDGNIFDGDDGVLATLETIEVSVVVEVDPDGSGTDVSDLVANSATGSANDARSVQVSDLSDDGTDPLTENTGSPGDDASDDRSVNDPTPVPVPSINATKWLPNTVLEASSGIEGNVDATFVMLVQNTGNIALDSLNVIDDLQTQLGSAFVGVVPMTLVLAADAAIIPNLNGTFDGTTSNANLLDGVSGLLNPNDSVLIGVVVEINPNAVGAPLPLSNQVMVSAKDTAGVEVSDLSDAGLITESNNPNQAGDTGGQDDATLLELPSISVAKSVKEFTRLAVSGVVGNFDVTYRLEIQNTGNVTLDSFDLQDDLSAQLGSAFVRVVPAAELSLAANPRIASSTATLDPMLNAAYDGTASNPVILSGPSTLDTNEVIVVELVVEVNPNAPAMPDTLFNQAASRANYTRIDGLVASSFDISDSGTVAESNGPGQPNDSGASDDPTPLILSDINISKQVLSFVESQSRQEGNIDVTYELKLKNKGNDTLTQIQVTDDLVSQLGAAFVRVVPGTTPAIVASSAQSNPSLAGGYTGSEDLFVGNDGIMAPNDTIAIEIQVELDPDAQDGNMNGVPDSLFNQALASAVNPMGITVRDLSDSGSDPESSNSNAPGDTGGMDDPTPFLFPVISVAKEVTGYALAESGTPGNLDVTYDIILKNTGNVPLDSISLRDSLDVAENLGPAHVGIAPTGAPTIIASSASVNPAFNGGFTGFSGAANIFDGISGTLNPCDSIHLRFTAEINPTLAVYPNMLFNQAAAEGNNNGLTVADPSDSGTDPRTNNLDGDTNDGNGPEGPDDPTPVYPCISNCDIACKGDLNVSVDRNCMVNITPSMVGVDIEDYCNFYYTVELTAPDGSAIQGTVLDDSYIGKTVGYTLIEPECGNSCWGYLNIEDKFRPIIECVPDTILCNQLPTAVLPNVIEGCSGARIEMVDERMETIDCDTLFTGRILRRWKAIGVNGMESNICTQEIMIRRNGFSPITIPGNLQLALGNNLSSEENYAKDFNGNPLPVAGSKVGVPTMGGDPIFPLEDGVICSGYVTYEDRYIQNDSCATKIMRTWIIGEWQCGGTNEERYPQIIEIVDTDGPTLSPLPDMTVSTNGFDCDALVNLPKVTAVDNWIGVDYILTHYELGSNPGNGGMATIPSGTSEVTYTAYDRCGNSSQTSFDITIIDNADPIAICERTTSLSLVTHAPITRLPASALDDGSFDECGPVTFKAMRMTAGCGLDANVAVDTLDFCCEDAGTNQMVMFIVEDNSGNTNGCMVTVRVEDKVPPIITCVNDMTVDCDFAFDPDRLGDFFGNPGVVDNCSENVRFENTLEGELGDCREGTLIRRIDVIDESSNQVLRRCTQRITFEGMDPLVRDSIIWPDDWTVVDGCDSSALNVENLPLLRREPRIIGNYPCSQIGFDYFDQPFTTTSNNPADTIGCIKIIRNWTVVDWCSRRPGGQFDTFSHQQVLKLVNTVEPFFTETADSLDICSYNANCTSDTIFLVAPAAMDDCTTEEDLAYVYVVDVDRDGDPSNDVIGTGNTINQMFPIGDHLITWTVEDKCGNRTSIEQALTLRNCKEPQVICLSGLTATLIPWDTTGDGTPDTKKVSLTPDYFDAGSGPSVNCGNPVVLSFSEDPADMERTYDCSDVGNNPVRIYAHDTLLGTFGFCETEIRILNTDTMSHLCDTIVTRVSVQGVVRTEANEVIESVEVALESNERVVDMTDDQGSYGFMDMPSGGTYMVRPTLDEEHDNGVTTLDLVLIQRHILGLADLSSPYRLLAADVNGDERITGSDVVELRKLVLGRISAFENSESWRFIDGGYTFPDALDPWYEPAPESYYIPLLETDMNVDFTGIKVGDVNGSATTLIGDEAVDNRSGWVGVEILDRRVEADRMTSVSVQASEDGIIYGWQYTLEGDIQFESIIPGKADISFDHTYIDGGQMKVSFDAPHGLEVRKGEILFTILLKSNKSGALSNLLEMNDRGLRNEIYTGADLSVREATIEWRDQLNDSKPFSVSQNQPNPWMDRTNIEFFVPTDGVVNIFVKDMTGRLLKQYSDHYTSGKHSKTIERNDLGQGGVLLYEVAYDNKIEVRKMILID